MSHQDTMIPEVFTTGLCCRIAEGPYEVLMSQLDQLIARELTPYWRPT